MQSIRYILENSYYLGHCIVNIHRCHFVVLSSNFHKTRIFLKVTKGYSPIVGDNTDVSPLCLHEKIPPNSHVIIVYIWRKQ